MGVLSLSKDKKCRMRTEGPGCPFSPLSPQRTGWCNFRILFPENGSLTPALQRGRQRYRVSPVRLQREYVTKKCLLQIYKNLLWVASKRKAGAENRLGKV